MLLVFIIKFVHIVRVIGGDWAGCTVADVPKREREKGEKGGDRFHVNPCSQVLSLAFLVLSIVAAERECGGSY